ncbi:MAG: ATP-binding protein [Betaproteobacteria bacterium]|nr:ATP-binding protein [Betaproteobacteria bacterium]
MRFEGTESYVATHDLMMAVNAALALERPLLIKGEPGTGKTMLARKAAGLTSLDREQRIRYNPAYTSHTH